MALKNVHHSWKKLETVTRGDAHFCMTYLGSGLNHMLFEFGQLNASKYFKCPNENTIWFNSEPKYVMQKCATPLVTVSSISRNDEHFWKPFGFTEIILVEPSEFLWC